MGNVTSFNPKSPLGSVKAGRNFSNLDVRIWERFWELLPIVPGKAAPMVRCLIKVRFWGPIASSHRISSQKSNDPEVAARNSLPLKKALKASAQIRLLTLLISSFTLCAERKVRSRLFLSSERPTLVTLIGLSSMTVNSMIRT